MEAQNETVMVDLISGMDGDKTSGVGRCRGSLGVQEGLGQEGKVSWGCRLDDQGLPHLCDCGDVRSWGNFKQDAPSESGMDYSVYPAAFRWFWRICYSTH
jgi:hypothetical protein